MSTTKFAKTHNLVAFLEKPKESIGFEEIIDFLNASSVQYALSVNPTIYTTCIEQFWTSAKVKTVNGERQIQALVEKQKVIISETSIRSDLKLDDSEGTDCVPTATIFAELERIGYENLTQKITFYKAYFSSQWKFPIHTILQCLSAKTTSWNEFSSTMGSAIICLATNQKFNLSKYIFNNMVKNLDGGGFSGRVTPLFSTIMVQAIEDMVEDSTAPSDSHSTPIISQPLSSKPQKKKSKRKQRKDSAPLEPTTEETTHKAHVSTPSYDSPQSGEDTQAKEIASLKKRVKQLEKRRKLRTLGLKRLRKIGSTSRVESSNDASLGAQEYASKQGRKIDDLDDDSEVTLVDETQEINDENLMFDTGVLEEQEKDVAEKEVSAADPVTTAGEVVTTANVEVTTVNTPTTTINELTLAQTLIEIKAAKPKAVTFTATTTTRPKARGVVVQEPSEFKSTSSSLQASKLP
ncbi:hypothetical protein Tco_1374780 [Tanacetum coccineum]